MDTILTMNPGSTMLFIAAAVILAVGVIVYSRDTGKISNVFFFFLAVLLALWSFFIGFFEAARSDIILEGVSLLLIYLSAAGVSVILFFFSLALATEKISLSNLQRIGIFASYALIGAAILVPGFIIDGVGGRDGTAKEILFGEGFALYMIFIAFYLLMSVGVLVKRYRESAGVFKTELRNILLSAGGASIFAATTNLILPLFGSFYVFWSGPLIGMLAILLIGYHIIKYNFWSFKLAATELFAALIIITLLVEIFITTSVIDLITKVAITLLVVFSSIFLVRSVRNEVEAKEEVEKLLKDITFANDELLTLDKRKSEFLSIASHHLRDPLTAIKGYASMLIEGSFGELSSGVRESMQKIFESSKRLVTIIEDFLNIAQIEHGEMTYQMGTVDFKKLVADVVEELSPSASRAGLWLHVLADGGTADGASIVYADAGKLRQVITNLIDNSVKYTPKGGVRIMLETRTDSGGAGKILLSVADTGIGMGQATLEKIFNKFSRAEGASKVFTDGSGLGLYIAKEILKKHEGRIWAESQGLGKGSTFFVELPMHGTSVKAERGGASPAHM